MKILKHVKTFNEHQENLNISDVSKRYLVKYVDGHWFEHETEVDAIDEDDAIKQVEKQCRNASHFVVSEL